VLCLAALLMLQLNRKIIYNYSKSFIQKYILPICALFVTVAAVLQPLLIIEYMMVTFVDTEPFLVIKLLSLIGKRILLSFV